MNQRQTPDAFRGSVLTRMLARVTGGVGGSGLTEEELNFLADIQEGKLTDYNWQRADPMGVTNRLRALGYVYKGFTISPALPARVRSALDAYIARFADSNTPRQSRREIMAEARAARLARIPISTDARHAVEWCLAHGDIFALEGRPFADKQLRVPNSPTDSAEDLKKSTRTIAVREEVVEAVVNGLLQRAALEDLEACRKKLDLNPWNPPRHRLDFLDMNLHCKARIVAALRLVGFPGDQP